MTIGLVLLLIGAGAATSWAASTGSLHLPGLEAISGVLLIAGLALLGLSMPIAQHLTPG